MILINTCDMRRRLHRPKETPDREEEKFKSTPIKTSVYKFPLITFFEPWNQLSRICPIQHHLDQQDCPASFCWQPAYDYIRYYYNFFLLNFNWTVCGLLLGGLFSTTPMPSSSIRQPVDDRRRRQRRWMFSFRVSFGLWSNRVVTIQFQGIWI